VKKPRRTAAGLALGAAGMLYSRLGGKRSRQNQEPPPPPPPQPQPEADPPPQDASASPEEIERARSELSDELARRARGESD
jgi:hypothetical protein